MEKAIKVVLLLGLSTLALVSNANIDELKQEIVDASASAVRKYGEIIRFYTEEQLHLNAHEAPSHMIAIMLTESFGKEVDEEGHCIRSSKGALGLMQIMPQFALKQVNEVYNKKYTADDLCDPDINIYVSVAYRKYLYQYGNGTVFASAGAVDLAYFLGPQAAERKIKQGFNPYSHWYVERVTMMDRYSPTPLQ